MSIRQIFLSVIGFSGGVIVAGGVFTVLITVGIVTRMVGKSHTGEHILLYENAICAGVISGTLLSVFPNVMQLSLGRGFGNFVLILVGLLMGIFTGCLAVSVADMLDGIPIFSRRIGFRYGLGIMMLSIALGKTFGSLFYFSQSMFNSG